MNKKIIKDNTNLSDIFKFESVSPHDIFRKDTNLNSARNGTLKNIPTRCLKEVSDICSPF